MDKKSQEKKQRPPIVVVLGHVDHGKTTLLDYIRKTNVAGREAGGITQSIGAYEITHVDPNLKIEKRITFIDTPGHEAFSKMRSRGVAAADIAILVVAVDDGVKPQTKEAIKIIQESKIPFVVALNKIDRDGVDMSRVKNELAAVGVLLEGYGGNVSYQSISAKTGEGIMELIDLILLATEFEDLPLDLVSDPKGFILEAKRDSRKGIVVVGVLTCGVLKVGDEIIAGKAFAKVRSLEDFLGKKILQAVPSMPVLISGFEEIPAVGDEFLRGEKSTNPLPTSISSDRAKMFSSVQSSKVSINLILKADVSGSLEALSEMVKNLPTPESVMIKIIDASVGDITDGDAKIAVSSSATIIGFRVTVAKTAENFVKAQGISVITSPIIYELITAIEKDLVHAGKEAARSTLEILGVFGKRGKEQVVGGKVAQGVLESGAKFEVERNGMPIGTGHIVNLQSNKKDAKEVGIDKECGLLVDASVQVAVGDRIVTKSS